ncbi:MAG: cellulase family glycosylhydrolase [Flavobacteriaceae bacterium]
MILSFFLRFRHFVYQLIFLLLLIVIQSCKTEEVTQNSSENETLFRTEGGQILKENEVVFYKGVNALQTYGLGNASLMDEWNITIVREFIGNLREQPIDGGALQGSDAVWYHPLQTIVNQNRAHGKITILCPFGWVDESGDRLLLTGLNPLEQTFYPSYKEKMQAIARHFHDQPDVWIEVWNEPFHWNNENNYSHTLWLTSMEDMVDNLKETGFNNLIVVPGNEQGQSEAALLAKAGELMATRSNLLFDLHAYEKWLVDQSFAQIRERLKRLQQENIPVLFGEIGVHNVTEVMPVAPFLAAAEERQLSVLAWLWNQNSNDRNALLTDDGQPHATEDNNFWGTIFRAFLE